MSNTRKAEEKAGVNLADILKEDDDESENEQSEEIEGSHSGEEQSHKEENDSENQEANGDSSRSSDGSEEERKEQNANNNQQKEEHSSSSSQAKNFYFEDVGSDILKVNEKKGMSKDDDTLPSKTQKTGFLRSGLRGAMQFKSFVDTTKDLTLKAIQSMKDTIVHKDDIHFASEKKVGRLSGDLAYIEVVEDFIGEAKTCKSQQDKVSDKKQEETKELFDIVQIEDAQQEEDEDDSMSEDEKKRLLQEMQNESESEEGDEDEDEEDDDDEEEVGEEENDDKGIDMENEDDAEHDGGNSQGVLSNVKDDDSNSIISEDIANRSLDSATTPTNQIIDAQNYLKYVSDRYQNSNDMLEVIDKNERSFKHVAEKAIQSSSQLVMQSEQYEGEGSGAPIARRLMHFKLYMNIANYFLGDVKVNQGVPYSIASLEHLIAIGSSDGSVKLFDNLEREIKVLSEKNVKNNAVMCVDIKRIRNNSVFIVAGHAKGQIVLYEIKGIKNNSEYGIIQSKHHKTISDIHQSQVISIKFFGEIGELSQVISVVSCDFDGTVYLSYFTEGILSYSCNKQCLMKRRIGPAFSIAPLILYEVDQKIEDMIDQYTLDQELQEQILLKQKNQIIAFGALDRLLIIQAKPKVIELKCFERPDYIEMGVVPYMDWGYGLSPTYRDKAYPILAIAWGRIIQLAVYTNQSTVSGQDDPVIQYDGFYICDGFTIDSCFFLSESILFILVNKKEIRVLYTQNFTPGIYDEQVLNQDKNTQVDSLERKKAFNTIKDKYTGEVSTYAEKDKGYRLIQDEIRHKDIMTDKIQQRSRFNFNPTVCKNDTNIVIALGKSTIGEGKLLHWQEYLEMIRKINPDDWLKVLRSALDIFNGKMVGLAGLPDNKESREQLLREKMKDLLRQNIDTCIREFQEGQSVSKKTLRVALEFCIRVGAIDHLFGELFSMFAEAGMEQRFFENLEPFVLSGKLRHTIIPHQILARMIVYYRQKDGELLEKALLNVDLQDYPNILEVRHICETEFLTSALIHMLTNLFDKDNELLCSLYNLIQKSKNVKDKSEIFKLVAATSDSQANKNDMIDKSYMDHAEKMEIQHSQTYIGYKLMWLIKLFLQGKKFPTGTLTTFKWCAYIYDIVRFTTNEKYLKWFLEFDPDTFFKLMKILFLDPDVYEYLASQRQFVEMYKDQINGIDLCMTHAEIIDTLHQSVLKYIYSDKELNKEREIGFNGLTPKGEAMINAFIFFIAQVSRKPQIEISEQLCIFVVLEMLKFHQKLMRIPNINEQIANSLLQPVSSAKTKDKMTYLYNQLIKRNEKDTLNLLYRCETDLNEHDIGALLLEAESSPMYRVRIYLHQLLGNYQKCLSMFFQITAIREDVFQWLHDIQNTNSNNESHQLRELILKNISQFVEMDANQTVKLTNQWFESDHLKIVDALKDDHQLIFKYINTILSQKEKMLVDEYNQIIMSGGKLQSQVYNDYKELILRFITILCQKKYRSKITQFVKKKYYPIDESLKICEDKGALEACAILQKRKGEYQKSIQLYLDVLLQLSIKEMISELYVNAHVKFNDPSTRSEHIKKFDSILNEIIKICEKYGARLPENEAENLWIYAINGIYGIRAKVFEKLPKLKNKDKNNYSIFLMIRTQEFMKKMSEYVNLRKIIQFLEEIGQPIKYQEFKQTFEEKVKTELYTENILTNAKDLLLKDLVADTEILTNIHSKGSVNEKDKCEYCKRQLVSKWDVQNLYIFTCGHIFHQRCAQQNNDLCYLCFNEFEQIQMILNQRGIRRPKKQSISLSENDQSNEQFQQHSREPMRSSTLRVVDQNTSIQQSNYSYELFNKMMKRFDDEQTEKVLKKKYF